MTCCKDNKKGGRLQCLFDLRYSTIFATKVTQVSGIVGHLRQKRRFLLQVPIFSGHLQQAINIGYGLRYAIGMPKQHFDGKGGGVIGDSRRRTCPPPDTGRGTGPDGDKFLCNKDAGNVGRGRREDGKDGRTEFRRRLSPITI